MSGVSRWCVRRPHAWGVRPGASKGALIARTSQQAQACSPRPCRAVRRSPAQRGWTRPLSSSDSAPASQPFPPAQGQLESTGQLL